MSRYAMLWSRRDFCAALGAGAVAAGWAPRLAWSAETGIRDTFRIVFYTDIHARVEWDTPDALMKATAAINERKPELILCGGDVITDGFESDGSDLDPRWDAYLRMHRALDAPVRAAIGNHDLVAARPKNGAPAGKDPRAPFRERMGMDSTHYSFDSRGIHFVVLDSLKITDDEWKYHGWVGEDQLAWLRADLAGIEAGTPVVLMTHVPLASAFFQLTEGSATGSPPHRMVVNNREVLEAFDGHRLLLVLQGHLHVNEMMRWRDTTFITGGAVAGKWWRGNWHGTEEGFGVLTLGPSGIDWEYVDYGWDARRPPDQ